MVDIASLTNIFSTWMVALSSIWDTFNTPIVDLFEGHYTISSSILSAILLATNLGSVTPLEFMLGFGLAFYIVYQLIMWFLNLIT